MLAFIWLSKNQMDNIVEPCSSNWITSPIVFAVVYGALSYFSNGHWNSQKRVYYCLVRTLWKCEYCLIWSVNTVWYWALNKSILFGSNSLKVSVLCDMNSESFYYSLIWKELSEYTRIVWCKLWKTVLYCLPVTLLKCQYCLIWTMKMYLLLFGSWKCEYCLI